MILTTRPKLWNPFAVGKQSSSRWKCAMTSFAFRTQMWSASKQSATSSVSSMFQSHCQKSMRCSQHQQPSNNLKLSISVCLFASLIKIFVSNRFQFLLALLVMPIYWFLRCFCDILTFIWVWKFRNLLMKVSTNGSKATPYNADKLALTIHIHEGHESNGKRGKRTQSCRESFSEMMNWKFFLTWHNQRQKQKNPKKTMTTAWRNEKFNSFHFFQEEKKKISSISTTHTEKTAKKEGEKFFLLQQLTKKSFFASSRAAKNTLDVKNFFLVEATKKIIKNPWKELRRQKELFDSPSCAREDGREGMTRNSRSSTPSPRTFSNWISRATRYRSKFCFSSEGCVGIEASGSREEHRDLIEFSL